MTNRNWAKEAQALMRNKGVKQKDLIQVFDVSSQGGVSHYFAGRYEPSDEQLKGLALALDLKDDYFLGIRDTKELSLRIDHEVLTEALQTVARHNELSDRDIIKFFSVYEQMNPQQVAEIYEVLINQKENTIAGIQNTVRKYAK